MSNFAIAGVQMHIGNDDNGDAIKRHVRSTTFARWWLPEAGRFGLATRYDKWFPEVQRQTCWQGTEVIVQVMATGTIDRDVETAINRTNVAVNQCYFIDVNGAKGLFGNGRSVIYAPEGELVHEAGEGEEVFPVMLDLERMRRTRQLGMHGLAASRPSGTDG